jgi:hypothetical protein
MSPLPTRLVPASSTASTPDDRQRLHERVEQAAHAPTPS